MTHKLCINYTPIIAYNLQETVINTKATTKYQKKQKLPEPEIREEPEVKMADEAYHKHGFSCANIKQIRSTAWLTVIGDAIENVVHGSVTP